MLLEGRMGKAVWGRRGGDLQPNAKIRSVWLKMLEHVVNANENKNNKTYTTDHRTNPPTHPWPSYTSIYDIAIGNVAHKNEHDFHCTRFQFCRRNRFRVYVYLDIFWNWYSESIWCTSLLLENVCKLEVTDGTLHYTDIVMYSIYLDVTFRPLKTNPTCKHHKKLNKIYLSQVFIQFR